MDFTIIRIGSETQLGNVTVVMQYGENVDTDLGQAVASRIARIVVKANTLSKGVGDTVQLDMDNTFKFEQRAFTPEEGENAGTTYDLQWVVPR